MCKINYLDLKFSRLILQKGWSAVRRICTITIVLPFTYSEFKLAFYIKMLFLSLDFFLQGHCGMDE